MPSTLDYALAHAARGCRVFPLEANGKKPAIKNWLKEATLDPAQIYIWFRSTTPRNIGIATGEGLLVIDIDVKGGVDGYETTARMEAKNGEQIPPTFIVATPSGGCHLYFNCPTDKANSIGKLGPGIDSRGHHGYVVAAGSTIDGESYNVIDHDEFRRRIAMAAERAGLAAP